MKINDLEFHLIELAPAEADVPIRSLLLRLTTDLGLEGWGESRLGWRVAELAARRASLLPVLAGRSIFDVEELLGLEVLRHASLRCAVEMACWDLIGRATDQPVCNLFGGRYRQRMPLAIRLSGSAPEQIARVAQALAEQGFHTQIVTSCGRPAEDIATLAAVRASTGGRTELRFDGRAGYDMETARDLCAELEYDSPQFFLDPLRTRELYPLAALGRQTSVPLAVGRAIHGPADVLAAARCGAATYVIVDVEQVGGITVARKCAAVAEAAGIGALLACDTSLGIATAAMLHLAASTPALAGCYQCAAHPLQDHLLTEPLEIVDGMITVPQGPGWGVEVDRAKVERYRLD